MKNKINILIVYWDLSAGGVQDMSVRLANGLAEHGHNVTFAVGTRAAGPEPYVLSEIVKRIDFDSKKTRDYMIKLIHLLRKNEYDIIYTATSIPNIIAVASRIISRSKAKIIISERDNPKEGYKDRKKISEKLLWKLKPIFYKKSDKIVCVSKSLAVATKEYLGLHESKVQVIYNPAYPRENEFPKNTDKVPHKWLQKDENRKKVIMAVGRLHRQKDYKTLLYAIACEELQKNTRLIVLGEGEERENLEKMAIDLKINANVDFVGMQKNVMHWLSHADLFVISSRYEGFGNVIVQAMASGLYVVATDAPDGPREILEDGKYGTLVPVGNPETLRLGIIDALKTKETNKNKNQIYRAQKFSLDATVKEYETLFTTVINKA